MRQDIFNRHGRKIGSYYVGTSRPPARTKPRVEFMESIPSAIRKALYEHTNGHIIFALRMIEAEPLVDLDAPWLARILDGLVTRGALSQEQRDALTA